jgi:hypothetical protein
MHCAKCGGVLDPQAGEVVDIEEAAVVDGGKGNPPIGQPVMLPFEEAMQRGCTRFAIGTIGIEPTRDYPGAAIDAREVLFERGRFAIARHI